MTLLDREIEFTEHLMDGFPALKLKGWPLSGAVAVAGNAAQESKCQAVTGQIDHGSDGSLQWRLDRLVELKKWGTKNFGRWDTLEAQAAFTLMETGRDLPELDAELRKGMAGVAEKDVRRVLDYKTAEFCWKFERPKKGPTANLIYRQQQAAKVFVALDKEFSPTAVPRPSVTPPVVAVVGGTAAAATAAAIPIYGGPTILVTVVLGAVVIGAAAILYGVWYMMRRPKPEPEPVPLHVPDPPPFDRIRIAAENIVFWKAEYADAADDIREKLEDVDVLLTDVPPIGIAIKPHAE